jgi:hypothetical protein
MTSLYHKVVDLESGDQTGLVPAVAASLDGPVRQTTDGCPHKAIT